MAGIKIKIQPSFWLFLFVAVVIKRGYFALTYTLAVFLHECAHYLVANKLFYRCKEIRIGIFGAVLYGDFSDVTPPNRIKIALAGPVCNLFICAMCLALWWILPEMYVFSEVFFQANLSMAVVNLAPFYPLDGGRVLTGLLENKIGKKSLNLVKNLTVAISLLSFCVFLVSLFTRHNLFNLGLFSLFLFSGVLTKSGGEIYTKCAFTYNKSYFKLHGMEKKTLVFNQNSMLYQVTKRLQGNYVFCLEVVDDNMQVVATYNAHQLEKLLLQYPPDALLKNIK